MKINMKIYIIIAAIAVLAIAGCSKILEEHPKSQITPQFFTTSSGIVGGIAGIYSDMRNLWGTEGFTNMLCGGTDEFLVGGSGNPNFFTYSIVNADAAGLWGIAYQDINTANGILQYGTAAGVDPSYLAHAKFIRALYYYYLIITYGSVPLHTTFITAATTSDSRQPTADVYAQIIKDLTEASTELQAVPTAPFLGKPATQTAALFLLAKVYLTRGWSVDAQPNDFAQAASIASNLILIANQNPTNPNYGLLQDFAQVNIKANDYGKESVFIVDHSNDTKYGEYSTGSFASGPKENKLNFFFRPNYPTITINYYTTNTGRAVMTRDIANGRPFVRIRPNVPYTFVQAFADKINDSRFDNTFQTVWIANTAGDTVAGKGSPLIVGRDTAIWTPPFDPTAQQIANFKGIIIGPNSAKATKGSYNPAMFPSLKKFDDVSRADVNDASTRPFVMFKFSELYLIAAEAYFKLGDNANAAIMLNALRTRAAFRANNSTAQNAAAVAAMQITPGQVTLDFILDERTRELIGEGTRWYDLTRTQSLVSRVTKWNPEAAAKIKPEFTLRPIPQTQIDLVTSGPPFPQNPGY